MQRRRTWLHECGLLAAQSEIQGIIQRDAEERIARIQRMRTRHILLLLTVALILLVVALRGWPQSQPPVPDAPALSAEEQRIFLLLRAQYLERQQRVELEKAEFTLAVEALVDSRNALRAEERAARERRKLAEAEWSFDYERLVFVRRAPQPGIAPSVPRE